MDEELAYLTAGRTVTMRSYILQSHVSRDRFVPPVHTQL